MPDPLAGRHGQPILSPGSPGATYAGRVVLELWEQAHADDAHQLTFTADAANGDHAALLERVASALPQRQPTAVPDPFGMHPIVSVGGPGASYAGRVIVEVWEAPNGTNAQLLTYSTAAAVGEDPALLERITTALPVRLTTVNKTRAFQS